MGPFPTPWFDPPVRDIADGFSCRNGAPGGQEKEKLREFAGHRLILQDGGDLPASDAE
jgi:hypothetical protein